MPTTDSVERVSAPEGSVVVTAHSTADHLQFPDQSSRPSTLARERFRVMVTSDCSDDNTATIAGELGALKVRVAWSMKARGSNETKV